MDERGQTKDTRIEQDFAAAGPARNKRSHPNHYSYPSSMLLEVIVALFGCWFSGVSTAQSPPRNMTNEVLHRGPRAEARAVRKQDNFTVLRKVCIARW